MCKRNKEKGKEKKIQKENNLVSDIRIISIRKEEEKN